jgi:hypothetical protein
MAAATTGTEKRLPQLQMPPRGGRLGVTTRCDPWYAQPIVMFIALSVLAAYAIWAALQGNYYRFGPYLSPIYSPELFGGPHSFFGGKPGWWPWWLIWSPAILVLWSPAGLRFTCYYFRGAYYRAFWADPPSCAVGELRKSYWGENRWPLLAQNVHRYFMYLDLVYLLFLVHDFWEALWFANPASGDVAFGLGVGSIVMLIDVILLGGYIFGCHSLRSVIGGALDRLSQCPVRSRLYHCGTFFNRRHAAWAWISLGFVAFTDLYIRLCAMGVIRDWRIF